MGERSKPCMPPLSKPCPRTSEEKAKEEVQDISSLQGDSTSSNGALAKEMHFVIPFDARFPNMNQTRRCWQNYVDYYRCLKQMGDDYAPCEYFKKIYTSLCPEFWIEQWDEQRENGTFAGKIE